jgi:hypothetical protein
LKKYGQIIQQMKTTSGMRMNIKSIEIYLT